jgi:hypothetical protein
MVWGGHADQVRLFSDLDIANIAVESTKAFNLQARSLEVQTVDALIENLMPFNLFPFFLFYFFNLKEKKKSEESCWLFGDIDK